MDVKCFFRIFQTFFMEISPAGKGRSRDLSQRSREKFGKDVPCQILRDMVK